MNLILKNKIITTAPTLTIPKNNQSDEDGLYVSTDTNSGAPTYYFRGNIENNYVSFAGFIWRIVRINEDGTIRIIMQDGINNNTSIEFNSSSNNYASMYYTNSEAKTILENWYNTNIEKNIDFANNLVTGNYFCEQAKAKLSSSLTSSNATMITYESYIPDFKCTNDGNNKGLVKASIGLITYDEIVYAGGYFGKSSNYYLYNNKYFWTMSPAGILNSDSSVWYVNYLGVVNNYSVIGICPLRPVLILKSDTLTTGLGTSSNPFVVRS